MKPPAYTYDWLQTQATEKVFARGEEYYDYHYVRRTEQRGDRIVARVEGTQYKPYTVRLTMKEGLVAEAACNCPYDWGGWCKHIIAVLLEMLRRPEGVKTSAAAEQVIDQLDAAQQRALLVHLADRYPRLIRKMETWIEEEGRTRKAQ